jgi:cell division control protein 6
MPSSVLGKRTRSSNSGTTGTRLATAVANSSCPAPKSPLPRAKRQARADIFNDENENPFYRKASPSAAQDGDLVELGALSESTPIKHGHAGKRFISSPVKLRGHFDIIRHNNGSRALTYKIGVSANHITDENAIPVQNPTPETPRHRDALSKKAPFTPRHRVAFTGKPLTPGTPKTPSTPNAVSTVYSQARQLFARSTEPGQLIGREAESQKLTEFVQTCVSKSAGGCTYVSGPPGTGKSAMVKEVMETFETSSTLKKSYINCMSIKTSRDLCERLLEALCEDVDVQEGDEEKTLQGIFLPKKKSATVYVVTLDEIDHIVTLDLESLYKIFKWSLQKSSHLVLVGIANALDLTDRFLPQLKALGLKPQLLPILPYTAAQIRTVITTRLKSLVPADSANPGYVPFLHPAAIELCSRKVSSQTGDLRKAFDICRRAVDLIEMETKQKHEQALNEQKLQESPSKKPLEENTNLASPARANKAEDMSLARSLATLTVETAPRASIGHVNKVTSATFGNGSSQRLKTLNLQQKAALCALVALEKRKREAVSNVLATPSKSRGAAPTVKALYDVYCALCRRDSVLHPLTSTEFRDVIGSLETLSLISAIDGKNGSFVALNTPSKRGRKPGFGSGAGVGDEKRVGSCVSEKEIAQAVEGLGAGILKSILSGEGLD